MKKMLRRFLTWVNEDKDRCECECEPKLVKASLKEPDIDWRKQLNFSFTRAHSGAILIVQKYNKDKEEHEKDVLTMHSNYSILYKYRITI